MNFIFGSTRMRYNLSRITLAILGIILFYNGFFLKRNLGILDTPIFGVPIPIFNWAALFGLLLMLIAYWVNKQAAG